MGEAPVILPDVNVLVYAHRADTDRHEEYRAWLEEVVAGPGPFGLSDLVLAGFLRVVTHPRIFVAPTPPSEARAFAQVLRERENRVAIEPGPRHWVIFQDLCEKARARGNLIPDAWFAALAIESGAQWVTTDGDFRRFPGLDTRHPLD